MSGTLTVGIAVAKIVLAAAGHQGEAQMVADTAAVVGPLLERLRRPKGIKEVGA